MLARLARLRTVTTRHGAWRGLVWQVETRHGELGRRSWLRSSVSKSILWNGAWRGVAGSGPAGFGAAGRCLAGRGKAWEFRWQHRAPFERIGGVLEWGEAGSGSAGRGGARAAMRQAIPWATTGLVLCSVGTGRRRARRRSKELQRVRVAMAGIARRV